MLAFVYQSHVSTTEALLSKDTPLKPCYGLTVEEHGTLQQLYLQTQQLASSSFTIADAVEVQNKLKKQVATRPPRHGVFYAAPDSDRRCPACAERAACCHAVYAHVRVLCCDWPSIRRPRHTSL